MSTIGRLHPALSLLPGALSAVAALLLVALPSRAQKAARPVEAEPPASSRSEPPPTARDESVSSIVPPKLVSNPLVLYPEGERGDVTVLLELVVGADGRVKSAFSLEGRPPFSEIAKQAALGFRFEPARRGDTPVAAKIRFAVSFTEPVAEPEAEPAPVAPPSAGGSRGAAPPDSNRTETSPDAAEPMDVTVRGLRPEPSRTATLSRAEVREIPGTFGDPFRAIETLPGVTPIVSGLPFFFVRGAPPGNVGYFLDGVRVPLLFHVGAGPSVVHPGLVERVDLYPGGYPARFGRFAGGVVSGETLPPASELRGEYNVRAFDAGGLIEVPFAERRATVLVGGRYSYTALLLSELSPDTALDYWDYQARATYELTRDDQVGIFAFGAYDFVGQKGASETLTLFGTEFHRADLRYDRRLGPDGTLRTAFTLGTDRSNLQQQDRSVVAKLAAARTELDYRVSPAVLVRAGTELSLDHYDVEIGTIDISPTAARVAQFFPTRADVALGARADAVITVDSRLEVTPGLRVDLYGSEGATAVGVDPRFAFRLGVSERLSLLGAFGIAHQPPAFVVPLPGFQPGGLRGGLQQAIQEAMGLELDLGDGMTATATVFQNAFFDMSDPLGSTEPLPTGCAPGQYPTGTIGGDPGTQPDNAPFCGPRFAPGTLGPDRSGGGGQAADSRGGRRLGEAFEVRTMGSSYGLELYFKRRLTQRLGGYLSYTLSRSTRSYGHRRYVASFDRTHVANAAVAYDLGRRWRAGARTVFYTGLPKIRDPADPDSTRLPPFFRLDLRLEKRWQLGEKTWIAFVAEWMNATLSKEAVTTTCTLDGCEAQTIGPVTIPSLGVEGGF